MNLKFLELFIWLDNIENVDNIYEFVLKSLKEQLLKNFLISCDTKWPSSPWPSNTPKVYTNSSNKICFSFLTKKESWLIFVMPSSCPVFVKSS